MIIELVSVGRRGALFTGEEPSSILAVEDATVEPVSPVRYSLRAKRVSGELLVEGELSALVRFRCSRCGEPFDVTVAERGFLRSFDLSSGMESVDLTGDIREAMLLRFSNYPVCGPDCKGLCPVCGTNLNERTCRCGPPRDARWGKLDVLKI